MTADRHTEGPDRRLDRLLAEARVEAPLPSAELLARIAADARAVQPWPSAAASRPRRGSVPRRPRRWFPSLGLPVGLATACAAGIWIGYASSEAIGLYGTALLDGSAAMYLTYEFPELAGLLPEG